MMPIAVKNMDGLGRFVIPAQARDILGIGKEDILDVFLKSDRIVIKKHGDSKVDAAIAKKAAEKAVVR